MDKSREEIEIGGTKVKTIRAVGGRYGDDMVRYYSADGTIYAYRDGDEHVVVSDGRERSDKWTKRVPAERTAVTPGEHLWSIPDNWTQRMSIDGNGAARYAIYHISESGVDIELSVPYKNHLVDAWWSVRAVGELTVRYDDDIDWTLLARALDERGDEMDDDVAEALKTLSQRTGMVERRLADGVNKTAKDALFERRDLVHLDGWTVEPWGDIWPARYEIADVLDVEDDVLDGVMEELGVECVIPSYPQTKVSVDDSEQLPADFALRALIEVGCTPTEAVDYFFTELRDQSQSEWARTRNRGQPAVSGNVASAKGKVK